MLKVESKTLEIAYSEAAQKLECSVTDLQVEIVQHPSSGFLGLFAKSAIIVVLRKERAEKASAPIVNKTVEPVVEKVSVREEEAVEVPKKSSAKPQHRVLNETILPTSFVTDQDDEDEQNDYIEDAIEGMFDDEEDEGFENIDDIAAEVKKQINMKCKLADFILKMILWLVNIMRSQERNKKDYMVIALNMIVIQGIKMLVFYGILLIK